MTKTTKPKQGVGSNQRLLMPFQTQTWSWFSSTNYYQLNLALLEATKR